MPAQKKPAAGDANDHYNHGLHLIMSIEADLRGGIAMSSSPTVVAEAEKSLKQALEIADNHGRAHIMLGNLYRYTDRAELGVPHFEQATSLPPKSDDWIKAIDGLASCHMMLKADGPAVKTLKLGIKHHPEEALFHYKLGALHQEAGRLTDATTSLQRVLEIEPGHGPAAELLHSITGGTASSATVAADGGSADYTVAQQKTEHLAKDLQAKMMALMTGPGSVEDKIKQSTKLQENFQKAVQKLYGN